MIGVLVVARLDRRCPCSAVVLRDPPVLDLGDRVEPRHHVFGADVGMRREGTGIVKRADHQVGAAVLDMMEEQRRAAVGAKAALDQLRTLPHARPAARPAQRLIRRGDQRRKDVASCLLAHAAMADVRVVQHGRGAIANRPALAAAGYRGFDAVHGGAPLGREIATYVKKHVAMRNDMKS